MIPHITKDNFFAEAKRYLPEFIEKYKSELGGRAGGMLSLKKAPTGTITPMSFANRTQLVGTVPGEKAPDYIFFSGEKNTRLEFNRKLGKNHISSFESENYDDKQYGGAILVPGYYVSFGGFPPHLDQKFVLDISLRLNVITPTYYQKVETVSRMQILESQRRYAIAA